MSAVRDISCDLIERAGPRRPRMTPHAEAVGERLTDASAAALALLKRGCLIDQIALNADRVLIRLHRQPPAAVFAEKPALHSRQEHGQWIAAARWADIDLEWPVEVRA